MTRRASHFVRRPPPHASLLALLALLALGCEPAPAPLDAGGEAGIACADDLDCDDGRYCNGAEICAPGATGADARGCTPAAAPRCGAGRCDEALDRCDADCATPDADGDGVDSLACGGTDCDDADRNRAPGRAEICDVDDRDEDCDPSTYGFRDSDDDGAPDAACCNVGSDGTPRCGDDCDDMRPGVGPTASEVCNGLDDDCDGEIDDGVVSTFYRDEDLDGYGVATASVLGCSVPSGYATASTDCDDTDASRHPGAADGPPGACNDVDDDCSGGIDEGCLCIEPAARPCGEETAPGSGVFVDAGECAIGTELCAGGAWASCIGAVYATAETCNEPTRDDDCDGLDDVAEGLTVTCFADADSDTYAPAGAAASPRCPDSSRPAVGGCPPGATNRSPSAAADCNDSRPDARPGAGEICGNGQDDNCVLGIDDGCPCTSVTGNATATGQRISRRSMIAPISVTVGGFTFDYLLSDGGSAHVRVRCAASGAVVVDDAYFAVGAPFFTVVPGASRAFSLVLRWVASGFDDVTFNVEVTMS